MPQPDPTHWAIVDGALLDQLSPQGTNTVEHQWRMGQVTDPLSFLALPILPLPRYTL